MGLQRAGQDGALRRVVERDYPREFGGLVAQLDDADAAVRRWAARDLAAHAAAAAALGARLAVEPDASVREALLTSLAAVGGPAAVDALLAQLRSEDAAARNGAIETLAAMPADVAPRIEALLRDADSDVRIFAVNLLGDLPHEQVPAWLAQVLRHEPQVNVVAAAVEVLAEAGGPEHVALLRAARARFEGDAFFAFAADVAIERIEAA